MSLEYFVKHLRNKVDDSYKAGPFINIDAIVLSFVLISNVQLTSLFY